METSDNATDIQSTVKIGLEVHTQLTILKTKLFCSCSSDYRDKEPNTLLCPTCLGLPGSLPVLNEKAVEYAVMAALALNCKISDRMFFFRKNYFYPDLPKNFQISQYDRAGGVPLATDGHMYIGTRNNRKKISISRVHLEEDPAKLVHLGSIDTSPYTLVDYNRSGITLLETVTEPDMTSPREARIFLQKLRSILEHLGIFDGSLEGAMRCDANISLAGGTRVEVKNISSFKEVERALNFEIIRQKGLVENGIGVKRETRHWDEIRRITISLRTKEEEQDYRYFPEPDLVPVVINEELIEKIRAKMPELPDDRTKRFISTYGLPSYDAEVLVSSKSLADFFEDCVAIYNKPKDISNWMTSDLLRYLYQNNLELSESEITPSNLVGMIRLIDEGIISGKIAKRILPEMVLSGRDPREIVEKKGLVKITDRESLAKVIDAVFADNRKAVEDALTNDKTVHFLIGQLMKATKGKADPALANDMVKRKLRTLKEGPDA
ncbi:MAG: Asp-tRNA(Asn)/Glu-tRNA(Gln) amidotransferase subunit GatB [Candidatus Bathyarchaeia archaeon]